jgi:hypothetical protein
MPTVKQIFQSYVESSPSEQRELAFLILGNLNGRDHVASLVDALNMSSEATRFMGRARKLQDGLRGLQRFLGMPRNNVAQLSPLVLKVRKHVEGLNKSLESFLSELPTEYGGKKQVKVVFCSVCGGKGTLMNAKLRETCWRCLGKGLAPNHARGRPTVSLEEHVPKSLSKLQRTILHAVFSLGKALHLETKTKTIRTMLRKANVVVSDVCFSRSLKRLEERGFLIRMSKKVRRERNLASIRMEGGLPEVADPAKENARFRALLGDQYIRLRDSRKTTSILLTPQGELAARALEHKRTTDNG